MPDLVMWVVLYATLAVGTLRWLRVAQREHYEPGRVLAIAFMWSRLMPINAGLFLGGVGLIVAGVWVPKLTLAGLVLLAIWPWGLGITGTSAKLAWTARLKRLAIVAAVLQVAAAGPWWRPELAALAAVAQLLIIEVAVFVMSKIEKALSQKYVKSAQAKLRQVRPTVVAITGSYGKTSTKLYLAQLLSRSFVTVASPASFNNMLGLSRAVNDRLLPGTEVFVAEMGTYGPGEIRELCSLFSPEVAAITTIGEAHLERMKDRATIVAAKSEITEQARVVVLNVDVPELSTLAKNLEESKVVIRVATHPDLAADVKVVADNETWTVVVGDQDIATIDAPPSGHPTNLAVAVGLARGLGVEPDAFKPLLNDLPGAPHRAELQTDGRGVWVIDDTYNSNPVGAARALEAAVAQAGPESRIVTITPGMIELGDEQAARNEEFARLATADPRMILAIVGRTNRTALLRGTVGNPGTVKVYPSRQAAAEALVATAEPGDVILYENDLPDHYA